MVTLTAKREGFLDDHPTTDKRELCRLDEQDPIQTTRNLGQQFGSFQRTFN